MSGPATTSMSNNRPSVIRCKAINSITVTEIPGAVGAYELQASAGEGNMHHLHCITKCNLYNIQLYCYMFGHRIYESETKSEKGDVRILY